MEFLYRGVNERLFEKLHGELHPRKPGKEFSSVVTLGAPHAVCGAGVMFGGSSSNEAIYHQWAQKGFPTSGILRLMDSYVFLSRSSLVVGPRAPKKTINRSSGLRGQRYAWGNMPYHSLST